MKVERECKGSLGDENSRAVKMEMEEGIGKETRSSVWIKWAELTSHVRYVHTGKFGQLSLR